MWTSAVKNGEANTPTSGIESSDLHAIPPVTPPPHTHDHRLLVLDKLQVRLGMAGAVKGLGSDARHHPLFSENGPSY